MAGSLNRVTLIGNVGKDPEIRSTQAGVRIANLTLATSETWNDKASGERKEKTEWHKIAIFNDRVVDVVEKYVKKGSKIYVEGAITTRKWIDKDGRDQYTTEINIGKFSGNVLLLDGRASAIGDAPARSAAPAGRPGGYPPQPGGGDLDDEIPF
jgi:single-strand DNA-binding protein